MHNGPPIPNNGQEGSAAVAATEFHDPCQLSLLPSPAVVLSRAATSIRHPREPLVHRLPDSDRVSRTQKAEEILWR